MFSKINLETLISSAGISSRQPSSATEDRTVPPNFDQIEISSRPTGEEKQILDLVSRISQELRTRPTHTQIESLQEEVRSGSYHPDPECIAAAMLLIDKEDF